VNGTVKKVVLAGVAIAMVVVGFPASPAAADPGDIVIGRCTVSTVADPTLTQGQNTGVMEITAEMLTSAHLPDNRGEVDCKMQVEGIDQPGTELDARANLEGLVQGQQQISYDDQGNLSSSVCEKDTWGDGDTTGWVCNPYTPTRTPAKAITDLINTVLNEINTVIATVFCPVLEQLHLGTCI
jgi:hypothetical protein